jgi:two-component system cell cycle sensor histidine kinase/response regulator CckA
VVAAGHRHNDLGRRHGARGLRHLDPARPASSAGGDRQARDDSAAIEKAAKRASALAERLLLASGRPPDDRERRRLAEIVQGSREMVQLAAGSGRAVSWEMAHEGGTSLAGPAAVQMILKELVANAVDATPAAGCIAIRVRDETLVSPPSGMTLIPPPGRYSVLEVTDTGRGIAPGDLPRVHEPFFTTRPIHEGRGLGLSVVYGIVVGLGGGLLVESVPGAGAGACVRVYLPTAPIIFTAQST